MSHAALRKLGPLERSAPTSAIGIGKPKPWGPRSILSTVASIQIWPALTGCITA